MRAMGRRSLPGRIRARGGWVVLALSTAYLVGAGWLLLFRVRETTLECVRGADGRAACTLVRARRIGEARRELGPGSLLGAELARRLGRDADDDPVLVHELRLLTDRGPVIVTGLGDSTAEAWQRAIRDYLASAGRRELKLVKSSGRLGEVFTWLAVLLPVGGAALLLRSTS
jgi:hypothetical protein